MGLLAFVEVVALDLRIENLKMKQERLTERQCRLDTQLRARLLSPLSLHNLRCLQVATSGKMQSVSIPHLPTRVYWLGEGGTTCL